MSFEVKMLSSHQEAEAVRLLRTRVFVEEQGVPPKLEMDEFDDVAIHAVAYKCGAVVGTGRLILNTPTHAHIGRMAIEASSRRTGIGSAVLVFLENQARTKGIIKVSLHAQYYVKNFYSNHGYCQLGDTFTEAGILHVQMTKDIEGLI